MNPVLSIQRWGHISRLDYCHCCSESGRESKVEIYIGVSAYGFIGNVDKSIRRSLINSIRTKQLLAIRERTGKINSKINTHLN
jgi:hypothetical protein